MNPHYPVPNSSTSFFNPLNPNPIFQNPQFNLCPPLPSPPVQSPSHPQIPLSDLPNCLSSLKSLLQSSNSTLQSLSSLLPPLSLSSDSLIQCPSNPNHWVPPNSLFLHSLHCPSSLDLGTDLDSLQYPKTLKSEQHLIQQNKFVQPLNDPTSELCFSLDDYVDFGSNFFYQGCLGVVSSADDDATRRIFTLPGVLSVECANFVGVSDRETDGFWESSVKILPSEMWVVKGEFEQWSDYPNEYSYSVVRAFVCLECVKESDLLPWLIANSPRFGVVIDVAMRDHMSVLFRLCLKAMRREAAHSYGSLFKSNVGDNGHKLDVKSLRFKCPVTVEVLRRLTSQLSILYGETSAKSFVIDMLRHLLLKAVSHALLFPLDSKIEHSSAIEQENTTVVGQSAREVRENEGNDRIDERILSRSVFVYQIAAAIAALHERSMLEKRIRALRNPLPLPAFQRMAEHQHISKKADEERQKRPDYRRLIEHDSFPFQRQHDQDNMKMKTREELLAEERDYKRRRMSYRGKKLKRSTKEVMRDIIEEYMEVIKETGGIGGLTKEEADGEKSTFKNSPAHNNSTNFEMAHHSANDQQHGYTKSLDYKYESKDKKHIDACPSRKERHKREPYGHRPLEDERTKRDRSSRDYHSRSPSADRRPSRPREHRNHTRNQDVMETVEAERSKSKYSARNVSSYNDQKSLYSTSGTLKNSSGRKDKRKLESPERGRWKRHENDERDLSRRGEFNDRYDPSAASG
ncbi:U11/U12 small nuclear ribonucleoprotein 48 kDa protein [Spinacia oleracea]|uniref:U11/U12 small nuclear ribonucleoprotein 48 kDa protein n=1 Tax=Spinacia oleracea TaxID=3562 RepID=A0A9R0K1V0_SPIOL|nr:U11/U12 small nuclear ribonucleoprotein 48 kDa protein [Spinacia oleracea]XP_021855370.2 U11/U12 small nuclear ribonucleoprotein 48 kDa protein [Spinacia oleracea]XP_056698968.1 U11/U12 small nuclear ribonucleoprotein 48 kDa protein [Spinacia oleracea]XP_056698969.1 U11/U12 small nuclear ribonucleoprotein 48 kDa protein [Spinacia oleracea]XP_056698970.1 U11/U12 small nuclear ribonucleoprotein 48 kDa protein [Spinacia oleracea]